MNLSERQTGDFLDKNIEPLTNSFLFISVIAFRISIFILPELCRIQYTYACYKFEMKLVY